MARGAPWKQAGAQIAGAGEEGRRRRTEEALDFWIFTEIPLPKLLLHVYVYVHMYTIYV